MAEATVTSKRQNNVSGNRRVIYADSIVFAANGDTYTTGLSKIDTIHLTPTTAAAYGFTKSAGVLTLVSGAGLTFSGSVEGY